MLTLKKMVLYVLVTEVMPSMVKVKGNICFCLICWAALCLDCHMGGREERESSLERLSISSVHIHFLHPPIPSLLQGGCCVCICPLLILPPSGLVSSHSQDQQYPTSQSCLAIMPAFDYLPFTSQSLEVPLLFLHATEVAQNAGIVREIPDQLPLNQSGGHLEHRCHNILTRWWWKGR